MYVSHCFSDPWCINSGYHEVPEEDKNGLSPAFQVTEATDKVIVPPRLPTYNDNTRNKDSGNTTRVEETLVQWAFNYVDFKFITVVVLLVVTIVYLRFYSTVSDI